MLSTPINIDVIKQMSFVFLKSRLEKMLNQVETHSARFQLYIVASLRRLMNQLRDSNRNFIVANNTKVSFVQDAFTAEAHALKQVSY
jgi:hypothetical protein